MKSRLTTLSLVLAALLAAASLAMAQPNGFGPGGWMAGVPQDGSRKKWYAVDHTQTNHIVWIL